jgi:hypothetical protein
MEPTYQFRASLQARPTGQEGCPASNKLGRRGKNGGGRSNCPGVAETRQYMLRGMIKDDEIGLDSDVARIAWSGA